MEHESGLHSHKRLLMIIIIIALLLHLAMMMVFVIHQNIEQQKTMPSVTQEKLTSPFDAHDWASRQAANSSFGAPVVFQDEEPDEHQEPVAKEESTVPREETPVEPLLETKEVHTEHLQEKSDITLQEQTPESPIQEPATASPSIADQPITEQPTQREVTQEKNTQPQKTQQPQRTQRPGQPAQRRPRPQQKQAPKNFSLAQLAQGFMEYANKNGDSALEVRGSHNGPPTDEQLKHERYWQKIGWNIQKTSRMHDARYKNIPFIQAQTAWHIVLNRDGSIAHLMLVQSSGNRELDATLEFVIKEASTAFPPVPTFFKGQLYPMKFVLYFEPYEDRRQFRFR